MKKSVIIGVLIVGLIVISMGLASAQYSQNKGYASADFVDENGDGICDNIGENGRDDDGDGIPNGQDSDHSKNLRDGSGHKHGHGRNR